MAASKQTDRTRDSRRRRDVNMRRLQLFHVDLTINVRIPWTEEDYSFFCSLKSSHIYILAMCNRLKHTSLRVLTYSRTRSRKASN